MLDSQADRRQSSWLGRLAVWIDRVWDTLFGAFALWAGLSVLATFPLVQLLSLGYLLEVSGRVARSGRLPVGLIGAQQASRWGSVALAAWLLLLAPRLVASLLVDAKLISPGSDATKALGVLLVALCAWIVLHTAAAVWRGGRLRHFLWPRPIKFLREATAPEGFSIAWGRLCESVAQLRLRRYFLLGLQGFVTGLAWLVVPTGLLATGSRAPGLGLVGGALLAAVVIHLPILQARQAASGRWRDGFDLRAVWSGYVRAPLVHSLAVVSTLLLAAPLYLLKIELVPREAAWLPSLLFVASVWPARVLAGWAVARARQTPRRWWRTGLGSVTLIALLAPVALSYAALLFLTRYASWYGVGSLYEQHAFLLPVPFLGY